MRQGSFSSRPFALLLTEYKQFFMPTSRRRAYLTGGVASGRWEQDVPLGYRSR